MLDLMEGFLYLNSYKFSILKLTISFKAIRLHFTFKSFKNYRTL